MLQTITYQAFLSLWLQLSIVPSHNRLGASAVKRLTFNYDYLYIYIYSNANKGKTGFIYIYHAQPSWTWVEQRHNSVARLLSTTEDQAYMNSKG